MSERCQGCGDKTRSAALYQGRFLCVRCQHEAEVDKIKEYRPFEDELNYLKLMV